MFAEIQTIPDAAAQMKGSPEYPEIQGMVYFFGVHNGTIVAADIRNLPGGNAFHGFHIHEGGCQGTKAKPFAQADGHYNPANTMHPQKQNHLRRRTDTIIRQIPCIRGMQGICPRFCQMTEMHF